MQARFALIEHTIPPHTLAAPVHTHRHEDEYSYVLAGRMGAMVAPGGFDRYFADLAPLLAAGGEPDFEAIAAVQARYELAMDIETIGPLSERFGLG